MTSAVWLHSLVGTRPSCSFLFIAHQSRRMGGERFQPSTNHSRKHNVKMQPNMLHNIGTGKAMEPSNYMVRGAQTLVHSHGPGKERCRIRHGLPVGFLFWGDRWSLASVALTPSSWMCLALGSGGKSVPREISLGGRHDIILRE